MMKLIWATRGRTWGFRFLLDGGFKDPLPVYDEVFSGVEDEQEVCHRVAETVALRLTDPLKRKDASGRLIPPEFVVFGPLADRVNSVEVGLRLVWPLVAADFARVWELSKPPSHIG